MTQSEHEHGDHGRATQEDAVYVCPMHPEERSDEPGDCRKCGMSLEPERPTAKSKVVYTCPMHLEVRADAPGSCPKCGMALEPVSPDSSTEEDSELTDMRRRFWSSAALTLPVFLVAMSDLIPGQPLQEAVSPRILGWFQLVLATPVVAWGAKPFFVRGWRSIVNRSLNMFTLIALGVAVAYLTSVAAMLAPAWFPHALRHGGAVPVYFEAAAVITVLVLLGQVLELRARHRTGAAVRELLELAPPTALRLDADGNDEEVPLEHVEVGDRLRVKPGDKVPVDGKLVEGRSTIDESMVTGESVPVAKQASDEVVGGTVNGTGSFVMEAGRVGSDTLLAQIVDMVAQAQRSRAPIQSLADRVSAVFVPVVVLIAVIAFAAWMLFGPEPRLAYSLLVAASVLIIACPCALGLATPMSIMVGTGQGARGGVLVRDAEALERMAEVDTLVVDKTGTLTEGRPRLVAQDVLDGVDGEQLLRLVGGLERASEHPLAMSLVTAASEANDNLPEAQDFESHTGRGVTGVVDGHQLAIGNEKLLQQLDVAPEPLAASAAEHRNRGRTAMLVALDGEPAAVLAVEDPLKETTQEAIDSLRSEGLRLVMLTGDSEGTARAVAQRLGIDEVQAEVSPEDKDKAIAALQQQGRVVAMAGDGINDAPALARADVGIAMGTGTDVAIESAAITLVGGELPGVARARELSRAVMRNIKQNLFFAFAYNALGVPLAAGVLYPVWGLLLNPMLASAAMSVSSVSVIANALRLRRAST